MIGNSNNNNVKGKVIWLFGRPCAGKSTIANQMAEILKTKGYPVITLDGDELRATINRDLNFSPADRNENIRRSAEIAGIVARKGFIVVCSFVTPTNLLRHLISDVLQDVAFDMIYINTTLDECKRRDTKGQYREAEEGFIKDFTGIGSPFEEPPESNLRVNTDELKIEEAVEKCLRYVIAK